MGGRPDTEVAVGCAVLVRVAVAGGGVLVRVAVAGSWVLVRVAVRGGGVFVRVKVAAGGVMVLVAVGGTGVLVRVGVAVGPCPNGAEPHIPKLLFSIAKSGEETTLSPPKSALASQLG